MPIEDPRSDAALLAAHAAGDPRAFGTLVGRHRDRMWAVALRTMRDPEEAADAVQDACISAFRAADSFRGDSAVTTWLHRIVVNACLDRIRRRQVRATVALPDAGPGEPATPGDAMSYRELSLDIGAALATLPDEQRIPILMVDVEGYSVAETANALGVAEGTVKSRCARGRAKLAVQLGHLRNPDAPGGVRAPIAPTPAAPTPFGAPGRRRFGGGPPGGR